MTNFAGKRVLVVEDEYFIAADLKRALVNTGADVVGPVGELQQALALAAENALDAVVLDVNLEGALTYELADALLARNVPILFVTGYDDWALPGQYRDVPRLTKPFPADRMAAQLAALMQQESKA